jgi:hypothetical protein
MKIEVDLKLFQMLVECVEKQPLLDKQDADTQARWKAVINETFVTANTALTEFKKVNMVNDGRTETGLGPIISPDKTSFL